MFEESISQFVNPAKEEASLDTRTGAAWSGFEADDVTREICALQPVETILWEPARTEADARLCAIAADCIAGRAPSLVPVDDAEKIRFRNVWQYCSDTNGGKDGNVAITHHPLVFSTSLGVFARDAFVLSYADSRCCSVATFTASAPEALRQNDRRSPLSVFCSSFHPSPLSLLLSMQMCVLACGRYNGASMFAMPFVVVVTDGARGQAIYEETGNAALMIALRSKTAWYKEHMKTMPF